MTRERPDWDKFFLKLAKVYAERATCKRRVYGAIIVNKDNIPISFGYCGNAPGVPNCLDIPGPCHREKMGIASGKDYSSCRSIHAEENALYGIDRNILKGCRMYVAGMLVKDIEDINDAKEVEGIPCDRCKDKIMKAGLEEVITETPEGEIKHHIVKNWKEETAKQVLSHYKK